jgi:hypothetical protein
MFTTGSLNFYNRKLRKILFFIVVPVFNTFGSQILFLRTQDLKELIDHYMVLAKVTALSGQVLHLVNTNLHGKKQRKKNYDKCEGAK